MWLTYNRNCHNKNKKWQSRIDESSLSPREHRSDSKSHENTNNRTEDRERGQTSAQSWLHAFADVGEYGSLTQAHGYAQASGGHVQQEGGVGKVQTQPANDLGQGHQSDARLASKSVLGVR